MGPEVLDLLKVTGAGFVVRVSFAVVRVSVCVEREVFAVGLGGMCKYRRQPKISESVATSRAARDCGGPMFGNPKPPKPSDPAFGTLVFRVEALGLQEQT